MMARQTLAVAAVAIAMISAPALASYTITQQFDPAPTYSTTLNFDEPGGPTGLVPQNQFAGIGISNFQSGTSDQSIGDNTALDPALPSNNTAFMNFGMFLTFSQDLTEFSFQGWDPSGPPSFFGGGAALLLYNNGAEVANLIQITPAWGGFGNSWYNITTSGGMTFDEVRFLGFGFVPTTVIDNLSWNAVPEPGSVALFALTGVGLLLRRRR